MHSPEHAAVGAVVSAVGVAVLAFTEAFSLAALLALWAYGVALSVFVDLDHFLIARIQTGDWSHLRTSLRDLRGAFLDQEGAFRGLAMERRRHLSHHLVVGLLVGALALVSVPVAAFTAVVLYAHVLCDLLRDNEIA
ncbi:hypothetical protein ACFQPA_13875 [Halomarina halobia]|uniref:DUF3307 domain-containing protein n=1 Tax=Halomarina halobia TaxID=3033386 RepID=A0ABD6A9G0_9EURY|nr:hypothetical protein [Halomarina sp. PSR21]